MDEKVAAEFGGRIRIRVCGLLFDGVKVLLINHARIYGHDFWSPPGGGVQFGEPLEEALKREFNEECNLDIEVKRFLFSCEFIRLPLHAIEMFFEVESRGIPFLGIDPEMKDNQLISAVQFIDYQYIRRFPRHYVHGIFHKVDSIHSLKQLTGLHRLT